MTRHLNRHLLAAACLCTLPALAAAQGGPVAGPPCSLLGGFVGVASAGSDAGVVAGAAAGWRLTPRVSAEARVNWMKRPAGEEAMSAGLSAQFRLPLKSGAVPFLSAGLGMHVAAIDVDRATPPEFYRRRIEQQPGPNLRTFTDPAAIFGAGIEIAAGRFVSWRPAVETMVVWRDSRTHVVTSASVQVAYHFEPHRVTPSARPRR